MGDQKAKTEDRRPLESDDPVENEDLENEDPPETETSKTKTPLKNEILYIFEGDGTGLRSVTYCGYNPINFMKVVLKKRRKTKEPDQNRRRN